MAAWTVIARDLTGARDFRESRAEPFRCSARFRIYSMIVLVLLACSYKR